MRYLEMGLAFSALGFVVANALLSILTIFLWRGVRTTGRRARFFFLLRMAPSVGSTGLVLAVLLPAFLYFEPRNTQERAGPVLAAFVILAMGLIVAGLHRGIMSWRRTRGLERTWRAVTVAGAPLSITLPAHQVRCDAPFAALVGIVHPRIYVSDRFLQALSREERRVVFEHEAGHALSFDNLKRTLMKLAPDWLCFVPSGREIETAWAIAAEEEADDHAAGGDGARSLDLASALLKALRMAPLPCTHAMSFCDAGTIARRVARLLGQKSEARDAEASAVPRLAWAAAVTVGTAALLSAPGLRAAYSMTEAAVRLLQ